jgi:hypothetical protein
MDAAFPRGRRAGEREANLQDSRIKVRIRRPRSTLIPYRAVILRTLMYVQAWMLPEADRQALVPQVSDKLGQARHMLKEVRLLISHTIYV